MPNITNGDESELFERLRQSLDIFRRIDEIAGSELHVQTVLRREYSEDIVRAALTLRELRTRAGAKFSRASEMWFDRKGLEQSSSEAVARYQAQRFQGRVWDYCCGIGSNAIALAEHCDVIAIDRNPVCTRFTAWNADVYGVASTLEVVCADVEQKTISKDDLLHIDPDRRSVSGKRTVRIEDSLPGMAFLEHVIREARGGAIKVSPAGNFAGKFPGAEFELTSLDGECKQATVWFGALAEPDCWRATVLPAGETLSGDPLEYRAQVDPLDRYLYDPDPAVVRAGLVDMLAERLDLRRLDEAEEYLTGDTLIRSPFVRAFEVFRELPNNQREIRSYFRASDLGQVEIKCRHIPICAEDIRRKLPLDGTQSGVLVFARIAGKARAVVCRRVAAVEQ